MNYSRYWKPVLVGILAVTLITGCGRKSSGPVMSRNDFKAAVMEKTTAEVIASVGKPDKTMDTSQVTYWYYINRTKDSVTDKRDGMAMVLFKNGRAYEISFN